MSQLNPDHLAAVISAINRAPFFRHMSMGVARLDAGRAEVVMEVCEQHMNPFGGLHGGAYTAALDTAAFWSAYCDLEEGAGLVSIDVRVDFLAPVNQGQVIAKGRRIKSGKTLFLTEAAMYDPAGRMLAHGGSKLMVTAQSQRIEQVLKYANSGALPPKFVT